MKLMEFRKAMDLLKRRGILKAAKKSDELQQKV